MESRLISSASRDEDCDDYPLALQVPRWKKVLFTLIPTIALLMVLEVSLRMTIPFRNVRGVCFHPIMERINCANVTGAIKYGVPITINAYGMIDKEYPIARTPQTLRVAVLGDSFTAGEGEAGRFGPGRLGIQPGTPTIQPELFKLRRIQSGLRKRLGNYSPKFKDLDYPKSRMNCLDFLETMRCSRRTEEQLS